MTEELRDVLREEAGAARVPPTDLGPVLSAGGRAVRRRLMVGTGAVAAVAAVAALAIAVIPGVIDRSQDDAPVVDTTGAWVGAWADAESLHFGDVEAPRPEHLYEMAAGRNGLLYIDWDVSSRGKSTVHWLGSDGDVRQIGQAAFTRPEVVGTTAAWFEDPDGEETEQAETGGHTLVVYDTRRMEELARLPGVTNPYGSTPPIIGISGSRIYFEIEEAGGATYWSWDYQREGALTKVDVPVLFDVSAGVRAVGAGFDRGTGDRFTDEAGNLIATSDGLDAMGRLSVDGRYFLSRDDDGWVAARTDGSERTSLELDGWYLSRVAGWDTSGRVTLLATRTDEPGLETDGDIAEAKAVSVVVCSPVDGSCEVVAADVGQGEDVRLADTVSDYYDSGL